MKMLAKLLAVVCLSCALLMAGSNKGGRVAAVASLPNPLGFPDTVVGGISDVRTATFFNVGQVPLYFTNFQTPPDFAIVQNTCAAYVLVGKTCTISFVFRPTHSGTIGEDLFLYGNVSHPYVQGLMGNGIQR